MALRPPPPAPVPCWALNLTATCTDTRGICSLPGGPRQGKKVGRRGEAAASPQLQTASPPRPVALPAQVWQETYFHRAHLPTFPALSLARPANGAAPSGAST